MELWLSAVNLGFLYAFMAIGVFITYKIYDFPDITVDGSFVTGAAAASVLIVEGVNPFLAVFFAFIAGSIAGSMTAVIHTRFKINGLLSGILVMTALYSINLRIMGKSNIPLLSDASVISAFESFNPGLNAEVWLFICLSVVIAFFWILLSLFFKTDFGVTMRATGNNPTMVAANGVNVNAMKIFGISLANGLVGISGGLVAQYQGFADLGMGVGAVVFSLAAVIIGEAIMKSRSVFVKVMSVIVGSILFRLMVALALFVGLNPNDLRLITALFVLATLVISGAFSGELHPANWSLQKYFGKKTIRAVLFVAVAVLIIGGGAGLMSVIRTELGASMPTIGIVLPNEAEILTVTRDGFRFEMRRLGYIDGKNCRIIERNASGDIPTVSTIVDKFVNDKVDIILAISTVSTQAAAKKVKDIPVVFATVADPFIIGVGKSDIDHPANITGVYGIGPIDELSVIARRMIPHGLRVGTIWNAAYPNSVHNVKYLQKSLERNPKIGFEGATITSTSEVQQAAQSLVQKEINAFLLVPDINVFAAFDAVVKTAAAAKIPIFTSDVERLKDGALLVYGYEYSVSGIQAAHMVNRILKGEKPKNIPYERYKAAVLGVNIDQAKKFKLTFPDDVIERSNASFENGILTRKPLPLHFTEGQKRPKKIALFQFAENILLNSTMAGVKKGLDSSGVLKDQNVKVDFFNAHGDFSTGQSIAKDIIAQEYDCIVTVSTVAMQVVISNNKNIPHVFGAVTDPIQSGAGKSLSNHKPNVTGYATPQPVRSTVKLMREIFPNAKRIGIIWNPAEMNSEICTKMGRAASKEFGFQLIEKNVTNSNEVDEALKSLYGEKVDLLLTSGDITVSMAVPSIALSARKHKIPYFTNTPADIETQAFACIGADYFDVGVHEAMVVARVIRGEYPGTIPIVLYTPEKLNLNLALANEWNISISEAIVKRAAIVIR